MNALILTTSIMTVEGVYKLSKIDLEQAKEIISAGFTSHIGHAATTSILSVLLDTEIPMSRAPASQAAGQKAVVFKLNRRLEEGQVLHTVEEVEKVGYTFQLLERLE